MSPFTTTMSAEPVRSVTDALLYAGRPSGNHPSSNWEWVVGVVVVILVLLLGLLAWRRRAR